MRKILLAITLLAVAMFALAASAAAPANFAGTWMLDKSKSRGLSQRLQNADSVTWVITQDDKQITVDKKVLGGNMPAGGGPGGGPGGGGGGRGGFGAPAGPSAFKLDGGETTVEAGPGKSTMKATWSSDGKTVELSTKRIFSGPNGEVTTTGADKLQLSGDGKVLTVNSHSESPRGAQDSTLVFNKQ